MYIRSSMPPRASVMAFSLGISSFIATSVSLMKILPLMSTESCSGVLSCSKLLALVCGRSSGTPTVNSGAETMKMINSTSMTSTIGVTLISAITDALRRPRREPPADEFATFIAMICRSRCPHTLYRLSRPLVDLARQDGRKFICEALQPLRLAVHLGGELVVENRRRDGRDQADRGGKQRLGDAGSHHRQRRVLGRGDRLEARHDAPDGAEQADEWTGRAHGGQYKKSSLQSLDFAGDRDVHDFLDPHLKSRKGTRVTFERAFPLAHRGHETGGHRLRRLCRQRTIQFLDRFAGPERLFEAIHRAAGARVEDGLVDRNRPDPDRTRQ